MRWVPRTKEKFEAGVQRHKNRIALLPTSCNECGYVVWFEWIKKFEVLKRKRMFGSPGCPMPPNTFGLQWCNYHTICKACEEKE